MALNKKIVKAVEDKTKEEPELKEFLVKYLRAVESGKQPKRVIEKLLNETTQQ